MGLGLTQRSFSKLVSHADVNDDGKLDINEFIDFIFALDKPLAEPSQPEARLRQLHEACSKHCASIARPATRLSSEFPALLEAMPDEAVPRIKAELDSVLVFSPSVGALIYVEIYKNYDNNSIHIYLSPNSACTMWFWRL